jgi:hypothetical protein
MTANDSTSEIIRIAKSHADIAGRHEPNGHDFMTAAIAAGVAPDSVRSAADVACTVWTNEQMNFKGRSVSGSLKPRADVLRVKIVHLEKQAPTGKSIAATRAELARVLAIDPAA